MRTWSSVVPGRTIAANRTGRTASLTITSGGSSSSPSSTGGTAPSTLFSIGTQPASARPSRIAASTAGLPAHGTSSAPWASGSVSRACSVKVACGPRNASRGTVAEPNRRRSAPRPRHAGPNAPSGLAESTWPRVTAERPRRLRAGQLRERATGVGRVGAAAGQQRRGPPRTWPGDQGEGPRRPARRRPWWSGPLRRRRRSARGRPRRAGSAHRTAGRADRRAHHRQRPQHDEPALGLGDHPDEPVDLGHGRHVRRPRPAAAQLRRAAVPGDPAHRVQPLRDAVGRPSPRAGAARPPRPRRPARTPPPAPARPRRRPTGAAVSIVRGVSRLEREKTVDSALGTAPRPVSTTSETSTGRAGDDRASSLTSAGSRDTGQTSCPSRPPWRPSRVARYRVTTASTPGALARGASRLVSSTRRSNSGGTGSRSAGSAEGTVVTVGTLTAGDGPAATG